MQEAEIQRIKQKFGIIGNARALNRAIEIASQVAPTEMTVLITGESGSGKESFSKIIHTLSPYKHGQFIAINCGAIPEGTIDSELFGHEKGAFTGATEVRKGYFEEANGGTIFLDEIGEMPLGTQARLLRVLEYGEFIKVGSSKVQKTKVRVVAATNVDLLEAVEQGKFREDLYYRLNTVPLHVPPLRERGEDSFLLFRKFAVDFADKYYVKPIRLTEKAKEVLLQQRFEGNIRQLKNLVEQISVLEIDKNIAETKLVKYLPKQRRNLPILYQGAEKRFSEREILYKVLFDMKKDVNELKQLVFELFSSDSQGSKLIKAHPTLFKSINSIAETSPENLEVIDNVTEVSTKNTPEKISSIVQEVEAEESLSIADKEKELIMKALKKHASKRKLAAHSLGISERTLYRKIKHYGIAR